MNTPRLDRLRALVEGSPDDARARYFLATELFRAEDWAGAAEHFAAYVRLSGGDDGAAYKSLGLALERLDRKGEAADAYRRGIESALAHNHAGLASELEDLLSDLES